MRTQNDFCNISAKEEQLESNHEEKDKSKFRDILQNYWPIVYKSAKGSKVKERLINGSRVKEIRESTT